jgi:integrase
LKPPETTVETGGGRRDPAHPPAITAFPPTDAPTRRPNAELRTREHLTPGEVEALIDAAKANRYGHRDATMILLALRHGLRAAEACDLGWDQVDFNAAVLHVRRVKNPRRTPAAIGTRRFAGPRREAQDALARAEGTPRAARPQGAPADSLRAARGPFTYWSLTARTSGQSRSPARSGRRHPRTTCPPRRVHPNKPPPRPSAVASDLGQLLPCAVQQQTPIR